ncbi:trypsin-like peptidase domain-containing protein [Gordonia sp. VNQ95]|uniref:S1C family serine protease n=1 Tax=Gordonia sp. VNQ95 TaxID=3156619 RepID=UPI0032B3AF94
MTGGGSQRGPFDDAQNPGGPGWPTSGRRGQGAGGDDATDSGQFPAYGGAPWERTAGFAPSTSPYGASDPSSAADPGQSASAPGYEPPTQTYGAPGSGYGGPGYGSSSPYGAQPPSGGVPPEYGTTGSGPSTPPGPPTPPPPTGFGDPVPAGEPSQPKKKGRGGLVAGLIGGALVVGLVAGGIGGYVGSRVGDDSASNTANSQPLGGDPDAQDTEPAPAPAGSVQEVAAKTLPSVVSIDVTAGNEQGEGSGVVLDDDGTIMTNNHVVSGSDGRLASNVVVNFNDGSRATAKVLGADSISDIAVIKVDKDGLTPIDVGTSKNLAVGQDVIAIGAPLGLEGTVTTGIISALNRPVSTSREGGTTSVIDAIQTDAAINPGNSGGALVNAKGTLIGINTAIATLGGSQEQQTGSIGLGFAIPIDQAIRVANELRDTGKATHAGLGVTVRPSTDPDIPGALIAEVTANGPADKAGIPKGAIVTKIDDRNITSGDALVAAVRSYNPGDTVTITYQAGGQSKTAQVTLATLQSN